MLPTTPLQLSDAGAGVVFGQKFDLVSPRLALHGDTSGFTRANITNSCHLLQRYKLELILKEEHIFSSPEPKAHKVSL